MSTNPFDDDGSNFYVLTNDEGQQATEVAVQSATALLLLMQKRVQTLLLQAEMSKSLRMPKKSSKDFTE